MTEHPRDSHTELLVERLAVLEARLDHLMVLEARLKSVESRSWIVNVFGSITLVGIVGFAFFLGTMNNAITRASEKSDKIYTLVLESKDSLAARTSVIESKLDNIDKKLDSLTSRPPVTK